MAILKCKMCGGNLAVEEGMMVCECEYCGSKQTVPNIDDEKKINLFMRANRLRVACEFDKAFGVYESIISEFPDEAEAYWGLILCKYGIEYVDDPKTGKKTPTCHRSSFDSVLEDLNFEMVMEYSDLSSRAVYREEAKAIEKLRAGIIEVSSKEEPYDIFICYKETDENGNRTIDSVLAQDVYDTLVEKGYKVFFSRITLEDKLGQEYEPYIFSALNSAKVMLVFGTDYEYYNAVWVKNEWSRFLGLIEKGEKKTLIPCYKDIDAYDMPCEFKKLQGQDMGQIGAIQDLMRGIEKIIPKKCGSTAIVEGSDLKIEPLLERVEIFLADEEWKKADEYCEKILDYAPKNAHAYLGKLLVEMKAKSLEDAKENLSKPLLSSSNYEKVIRFADDGLKQQAKEIAELQKNAINEKKELDRKEKIYIEATEAFKFAKSISEYNQLIKLFEQIPGYKDADDKLYDCKKAGPQRIYDNAVKKLERANSIKKLCRLVEVFDSIKDYKDSAELSERCKRSIEEKEEKERIIRKKANDVFVQYKIFVEAKITVERERELHQIEQEASKLEKEIADMENRLPLMRDSFSKIVELNKQYNNINAEIVRLTTIRNSLGIFAGKEKKTIDEQIVSLKSQQVTLEQDCNRERTNVAPYKTLRDVADAIERKKLKASNVRTEAIQLADEIQNNNSFQGEVWEEFEIYKELLDIDILRVLMKSIESKKLLSKDCKVTSFISSHPIETIDADYSHKSIEELNKIEKLDYWKDSYIDKRSEEQLMDDIEEYLENADLLDDFFIEREVNPAEFEADKTVKKHYGDMGTDYNGNPYSAEKYGRPASFVIRDWNLKIKLVIMVTKESSYNHWLVRWCEYWCEDNKVPYLRLLIGKPNMEHYVLRHVYEKLHLIDAFYFRDDAIINPLTREKMRKYY